MKLLKLDLLTLLISLFILGACQNPDGIGLDVDPSVEVNGKLIDTITIKTSTVLDDSLLTNNLSEYPLGHFNDPLLGETQSSIAMSLTLPSTDLKFGTAPVLDSAVLVLKYSNEYFGDSNSALAFEVYQLSDKLTAAKSYFNTSKFNFNSDLKGSKTVKANIKDSILIKEIVKGKPDVDKKVGPQIRIPIKADFIKANFFDAAAENFKDQTAFTNFIKGLYVKINKSATNGAGGLVTLDLSSADGSKLELYYKSPNGTAIDTTVNTFAIQNSASPVAASMSHNYSADVINQLNNPNAAFNFNYVQPMAGLRTQLRFPYLANLKASLGNITVNKAELIVTVEGGTDIFAPAPKLFLYRTDIAEQRQLIPDATERDPRVLLDSELGGFYDTAKKRYKFTLTAYVQDIVNGTLKQYNTYISAVDLRADRRAALISSGTTASRAVIGSGKPGAPSKMKLNIIYTKAN